MRYFIHGEEITAAEAETINAENQQILARRQNFRLPPCLNL